MLSISSIRFYVTRLQIERRDQNEILIKKKGHVGRLRVIKCSERKKSMILFVDSHEKGEYDKS
jgi:hypothetical protein